jgi:DNA/RNA non-specific endonuclease
MNMLNYRIGCMLLGGILLLAGCGEDTPVSQVPTQLSVLEEPVNPDPQPVEPSAEPTEVVYDRMAKDLGGEAEIFEYLNTHSESEDREMVAKYGIGYEVSNPDPSEEDPSLPDEPITPGNPDEPIDPGNPDEPIAPGVSTTTVGSIGTLEIKACPNFFPANDRNKLHVINGTNVFIDQQGRPFSAQMKVPPLRAAPRIGRCQSFVGRLGGAGYDGGHLVGSSMGGWGGRANMVPQNSNFNRGVWAQAENAFVRCQWNRPPPCCTVVPQGSWKVRVTYPNIYTTVPTDFDLEVGYGIPARFTRQSYHFKNLKGGGLGGSSNLDYLRKFLKNGGC